jgi:hypothetical protein
MEPYDPINPPSLESIDSARYQAGFDAKLRDESLWHWNWLDASWRTGWFDARKQQVSDPELRDGAPYKFSHKRKGNK